jgi:glucosamine-6-phosphate deaminase
VNLMQTLAGSMMEGFFPKGWDLEKIDACCSHPPDAVCERQPFWHARFEPRPCDSLDDFAVMLGHEIASQIRSCRDAGRQLALILPVGPMGMYRWTVYFLKEWGVGCEHVHGFNMDEWSDAAGNTLDKSSPGSFEAAMEEAFYGPLGKQSVPASQRHFATKEKLPKFGKMIRQIKAGGGKLATVYGIGRAMHIAFWEPHFAAEYPDEAAWRGEDYRIAAKLHPLTIEQNAITSFRSRTTLVPAFANTIGPGLFLSSDYAIGGADGALGRGMMWQGLSLWTTLRHGPTPWLPSTYMPTLPGRLYFLKELAGPLSPECH